MKCKEKKDFFHAGSPRKQGYAYRKDEFVEKAGWKKRRHQGHIYLTFQSGGGGEGMGTNTEGETEIFWANTNRLGMMEGGKGDDEGYMAKKPGRTQLSQTEGGGNTKSLFFFFFLSVSLTSR